MDLWCETDFDNIPHKTLMLALTDTVFHTLVNV
jgi:hypothetical protein